jgi:hypothetical protein
MKYRILTVAALAAVAPALLAPAQAAGCRSPLAVCQGIAFCIHKLDRGNAAMSAAIAKAIDQSDGNGVGIDTAWCQHHFGGGNWDWVSGGCSNAEYVVLGKKGRSGDGNSCL